MKVFSIAKIIILREFRDVNIMLIMCAMPIVLILLLGIVFSNVMGTGGGFNLGNMHVTYAIVGEETQMSSELNNVMGEMLSDTSSYSRNDDVEGQLALLRDSKITAFILIDENSHEITLYKNSNNNTASSIIETAIRSFVSKYNLISEVASVNPLSIQQIVTDDGERQYITKIGLEERYQPSAMDYYGVTIVSLFVLYGFLSPLINMINDRKDKLALRINTTAVNSVETFLGTVLGYVLVGSLRLAIVIATSKVLFHVNWGDKPLYAFLLLFALITLVTSIGMVLGQVFKSESVAAPIAHTFIITSAFFGGVYVTLESLGSLGRVGKYFSAIWWTNRGILNQIYNNDYSYMKTAFIIFITSTVVLLGISVLLMQRKEVYADD